MWIATAEQSRNLDRRASEEFGIPVRILMERAGLAAFASVAQMLPQGGSLAIVCGKGNNGGDGFVVAGEAHHRGFLVACLVAARRDELTAAADEQRSIAESRGVQCIFVDDAGYESGLVKLGCHDLIVDGLLGTGARGAVGGPIQQAIQAINRAGVPVLSLDLPSGIDADTGEELGESVWALKTVTFGQPKRGLFQGIGLEHAGYWEVADIGFPRALLDEPTEAGLVCCHRVGQVLPERLRASHKGENGSLLIVAGSEAMPGAASLTALGALRAGAGLVTVASIPSVCHAVAANVPEAITIPLPERYGTISPDAATTLVDIQTRYHAAVFGPGLTHREAILNLLSDVWAQWVLPSVIDADALNAVSQGIALPRGASVLTPHPGELSRMMATTSAEVQSDRFGSIAGAVKRFEQVCLLKGPYTITGAPGEPMCVNTSGNPGMASGGMGDVLSGVIGTLLAQELPPLEAAVAGAYWHGRAADHCAEEIGGIGYLARDLANALPRARAKITASCDSSGFCS